MLFLSVFLLFTAVSNVAPQHNFHPFAPCSRAVAGLLDQIDIHLPPYDLTPNEIQQNIRGIREVVEKENRVKILSIFGVDWIDDRLVYGNLSECANVTTPNQFVTLFPASKIWFPWFILFNAYEETMVDAFWERGTLQIFPNGRVSWWISHTFDVVCVFDLRYFPLDTQTCDVWLRFCPPLVAKAMELSGRDEMASKMRMDEGSDGNKMWTITNLTHKARRNDYRLTWTMERSTQYHAVTILVPTFILAPLSSLAFVLPVDSGEKLSVSFTTMLTYFIMSLTIEATVPATPDLPILMQLFSFLVVASLASAILAAVICRYAADKKRHHLAKKLNTFGLYASLIVTTGGVIICVAFLFIGVRNV